VDWSPTQNLIAYPYNAPTVFSGPGSAVFPLTAIQLIEPSEGAADQGKRRQLTFPAGAVGQVFDPVGVSFTSDYAPAFSPDGLKVAYVRALTLVLTGGTKLPITPSIRIVNVDGSNDHEVIHFQQGSYLTRLSWSPDGQQLIFDLGQ
jgi:Tol biopolymer transport system component